MGSVTSIRARAAAISDEPHRAHRGHRCELADEVEALRAEVAELRAAVQRQAEGGDGADLAVLDIAFEALGVWRAVRLLNGRTIVATDPESLRALMVRDHGAEKVPGQGRSAT